MFNLQNNKIFLLLLSFNFFIAAPIYAMDVGRPFAKEEFAKHHWPEPTNVETLSGRVWPADELLKDPTTERLAVSSQEMKDHALKVLYKKSTKNRNITLCGQYKIACCLAAGAQLSAIEGKFTGWLAHRLNTPADITRNVWQSFDPTLQKNVFLIVFLAATPKKN